MMNRILLLVALLTGCFQSFSQKLKSKDYINDWKNAVVNLETEGLVFSKHSIDSIVLSKQDSDYSRSELDSIKLHYSRLSFIETGTAIYLQVHDRKYLITAKHVIFDAVLSNQKMFENNSGPNHWDNLDAIFPRISVRTPFSAYLAENSINSLGITNNNFVHLPQPYFFISDSTGDGIGCISLQDFNYKKLDTLLQQNGYKPISVDDIDTSNNLNNLDEVFAIGFPENVSVVRVLNFPSNYTLAQLPQIVVPFFVQGHIAMFDKSIQHFYVDITVTPGNSGSPILKNGKLIGIVSAINKYHILNDNINDAQNQNLYGIGHLVAVINIKNILKSILEYQEEEDKIISAQKNLNP